jgi:hypothetical protein
MSVLCKVVGAGTHSRGGVMVGWWKRVGATAFLGGERLVVVIDDRRWFLQLRERRGW